MTIKLRITDANGTKHIVEVQAGQKLEVQPGQHIEFVNAADAQTFNLAEAGSSLIIRLGDGQVELVNFFLPPDTAQSQPEFLFKATDGDHVIDSPTDLLPGSHTFVLPPSEGIGLPEGDGTGSDLAGGANQPGAPQPLVLPPEQQQDQGGNPGGGGDSLAGAANSAGESEIFAGFLESTPTFSASNATITEGGLLSFTVTRTGKTDAAQSVDFQTIAGSAADGPDFTGISGTLDFAIGETSKTVQVTTIDNAVFETAETLSLQLSNPTGEAVLGTAAGTGTILDNDPVPVFDVATSNTNEGSPLTFTVTRSNGVVEPVQTVSYSITGGTATPGVDFTGGTGSISFNPGETVKNITLNTVQDALFEGNESLTLSLSGATNGAVIGTASASSSIIDDDPAPTLAVAPGSGVEGNNIVFTITRTGDAQAAQTVAFNTSIAVGDTAAAGDFTATSGTVTFNQGETTKTVSVASVDDLIAEGNETFTLALSNATGGAVITGPSTSGTIVDNDVSSFIISNVSGNEGDGTITVTVTRTLDSGAVQTVNYATADGTAVGGGQDYTGTSGILTFNPGTLSQSFTVAINDDGLFENAENFLVNLSTATGGALIGTPTGQVTINDNDAIPSFSIAPSAAVEGAPITFTVTRTGDAQPTQTVSFATLINPGDSATTGDFTSTTGTLTFNQGDVSQTFIVNTTGDTVFEPDETFSAVLSGATGGAVIGTATAAGTISNDDPAPSFSITSSAAAEDGSGIVFTVTRNTGTVQNVQTVDVFTSIEAGDSALANDFTPITAGAPQTLSFNSGVTSQSFTVATTADAIFEGNETFTANLTNASGGAIIGTATATGTINNDDSAPVFNISGDTQVEGTALTFTVTRVGDAQASQQITYGTSDGTATLAGLDYSNTSATLTFAQGVTTQSFTVNTGDDAIFEPTEDFTVSLNTPTNGAIIGTGVATGTITDNDTVPIFSIAASAAAEDGSGIVFTVTRSTGAVQDVQTVDVFTSIAAGDTAAAGDFTGISAGTPQTLSFASGITTQSFTVATTADAIFEGNETFTANLANASGGATIGAATAIGTITNDDANPLFNVAAVAGPEGNLLTFTVTRTGDAQATETVAYATSFGTATATDFTPASAVLSFAQGVATQTFTVATTNDTVFEPDETFTVTLSSPTAGGQLGASSVVSGTIQNDDPAPSFAISDVSAGEGNVFTFTVTRSGDAQNTQAVDFATSSGTATQGVDYAAAAGTLSFNQGETSKTFTVTSIQDGLQEGNEAFTVTLSNATAGANIGTPTANGTIIDDDIPTFNIDSVSATEGGNLVYTISRTLDSTGTQTVDFTSADGSATAPGDYTASSGTLSFTQGQMSQTITIGTVDDSIFEGNENLTVTLSNAAGGPVGANIGSGVGTGTINENDLAPVFNITAGPAATEGGTILVTVTRMNDAQATQSVDFATSIQAGDTAAVTDFTATSGTLSFATGVFSQSFTVATTQDAIFEADETLTVSLSNPGPDASIGTATTQATITNDEAAPQFSIGNAQALEDGSGITFTVTRSGDAQATQTVAFATTDGSATVVGSDYTANSGTLTFNTGELSQTFVVATTADAIFEGDETLTATISNPTGGAEIGGSVVGTAMATGTILNDDAAPSFSIANAQALEDGSGIVFTVTRAGDAQATQTVDAFTSIEVVDTALANDFTAITAGVPQTLSFNQGELSKTFVVSTTTDAIFEGDETFSVNLANATGGAGIATATASGTILNDEIAPNFSITNAQAFEDGAGITFTVTRSGDAQATQTVDFATMDGSATVVGSDYTAKSGTLTFNLGDLSQTFTVLTTTDAIFEADETFTATLSNATGGAGIASATATGTIQNDDAAPVFSIGNAQALEDGSGIVFTVTRAGDAQATQTVNFATSIGGGDTASVGDFTANAGMLTFNLGETSKTFVVTTSADAIFEADETFTATLSNATGGAGIASATATGTIQNDEAAPAFSITDASGGEAGSITFTVTRSGDAQAVQMVDFATSDNASALAGTDYTATAGTLTFNPGELSQTFTVNNIQDALAEGNETFTATLTNPTGSAVLGTAVATGTIIDDDIPTFNIDSVSAAEGGNLVFTVSRTLDSIGTQTVNFTTVDGSATVAGGDYAANAATLSFTPGVMSQTLTVTTTDDALFEGDETFSVTLSNAGGGPAGANIGTGTGTGTITDNEAVPQFDIVSSSVTEGGAITFTVTRSVDAQATQTVDFATSIGAGDNASAGDFTATSGTLSFAQGVLSQSFTVATTSDTSFEPDETFSVGLANATAGASIGTAVATGTILNDEAVPSFSISNASVTEGGLMSFTVTRSSGAVQNAQTVDFATSLQGTDTAAVGDFTAASGTLSFANGETAKTFTVQTTADAVFEGDETFTATLSNPTGLAALGTATASGTILNDEPAPAFNVTSASALEGNPITFTVTRTGDAQATQTVHFATSIGVGDTASIGDFTAAAGTLSFAQGELSKTVVVNTTADTVFEDNETFTLGLSNATGGAVLGNTQVTGTIFNDEPSPQFSIGAAQALEDGAGISFTVTRSGDAQAVQTVDFATSIGGADTASVGDFTAAAGTLSFNQGQLSQTFVVATTADAIFEADETFSTILFNPTGGSLINGSALGSQIVAGTILNDDAAPSFSIANAQALEDGSGIVFTVTRSGDAQAPQAVNFATSIGAGDTASVGDFTAASGTLTFNQGVASQTFVVATTADTIFESDETFTATLSAPTGGALLGTATASGTIQNDEAAPQFGITAASGGEGSAITFTVTRSGDAQAVQTVTYTTADNGSALAGTDYTAATNVLTFNPGQLSQSFTVSTLQDALAEGNETFDVTLSAPTGGAVLDAAATVAQGTIIDDDIPTFNIDSVNAVEGGNLVFTVSRTLDSTGTQTVQYATSDGTAIAGSDYTAVPLTTLSFNTGVMSQTITVISTQDPNFELDETFNVTLSNAGGGPAGANIGTATGIGTITDDDPVPNFSIASSSAAEDGTGIVFTVTRSTGAVQDPQTVDVFTSIVGGDTASANDFTAITAGAPQTLTFASGVTTQSFTVATTADAIFEGNETFTANLTNASGGATIATATATGTINNDDAAPVFNISGDTQVEGTALTFTVTRVGDAQANQQISFATSDGTATLAGLDYSNTSGTLTFNQGSSATQTFTVNTGNNAIFEPTENFTVSLNTPTNGATIGTGSATGTITDDDPVPNFSIASSSAAEDGTGIVFTVTRSTGAAQDPQTVDVFTSIVGGDTASANDFTAITAGAPQTLTFASGVTTQSFTVATTADAIFEGNETFTANLTNASGGATIATATATGTINNDDPATSFVITPASATEGDPVPNNPGTMTFFVTRVGDAQATQQVNYATSDLAPALGHAVAVTDYTPASGVLSFSQGQTIQSFTVTTKVDNLAEGNEDFLVTLSGATMGATIGTATANGTIVDDDIPVFSITGGAAAEGGTITFTVTRDINASGVTQTVNYALASGTATAGTDFGPGSGAGILSFADGVLSQTFTVSALSDTLFEGDETFTATISNALGGPTGANIGSATATGTITDTDTPPVFNIASNANTEGSGIVFTVTRSGDAQATETVDFATSLQAGDSASIGDFSTNSGTLSFAQGVTTRSFTVATTADSVFEPDETFTVSLSNASGGATLGAASAQGTISNDEATPLFSIAASSGTEGGAITFTVTRDTGSVQNPQSVDFATSIQGGDTTSIGDFNAATGTLSFASGETAKTFTVSTNDDTVFEPDETFTVTLSNPTGLAGIATATATGTILDNEPAPSFSIGNASVTEGGLMSFTVTRSSGSVQAVQQVTVGTADGTALAASDYTAVAGQVLTFNPGQTSKTFTVQTTQDTVFEADETFTATLSAPTNGAVLGTSTATGTILNDESAPVFSIANVSLTEGGLMSFTVTRSTGSVQDPQTVDFATSSGTATQGTDFTAATGTLTFNNTETSKTFTVQTTADTLFENDETFNVVLSNATGGALISGTAGNATGTILDNEAAPQFSIGNATILEGGLMSFTVTRSGDAQMAQGVDVATSIGGGDTASIGDFTATSTTLSFNQGELSKTFTVQTTQDAVLEGDETFTVTLSTATGGAGIATATGVGTITNDDPVTSFAIGASSVTEGGLMSFSVTRTGDAQAAQTVDFSTAIGAGDTASAADFTSPTSGTLSFNQGETVKTFTVQTTQDTIAEGNETFSVSLSNNSAGSVIGTASASGTIIDDDIPVYSISNASALEDGTGIVFTVTRSLTAPGTQTIDFVTSIGTGDSASVGDFTAAMGTLSFNSTATSQTFTVATTADLLFEADETFTATLSNVTGGGQIGAGSATGTISNDDAVPGFSISNASALEDGTGIVFTVTRSSDAQATETVGFATSLQLGDTASIGDFTATSGTLSFATGVSTQSFTVATTADAVFEANETFTVGLGNATGGATITTASAQGIITNDDPATSFSIAPASATEGGSIIFTVTRTGDAQGPQTVDFATSIGAGDTASVSDFTATSGILTFNQGEASKTFTVSTVDDVLVEADETFTVNLSNATAGGVIGTATANGTIIDNDSLVTIISNIQMSGLNGGQGLKLNGIDSNGNSSFSDDFGISVSGVGDVNGDGIADVLIGANKAEPTGAGISDDRGEAYVFYGDSSANLNIKANGTTGFDMASLNGADGIVIRGSTAGENMGETTGGGGDFNGDGVSDLLMGNAILTGSVYTLYGDADPGQFSALNGVTVSSLPGTVDLNGDGLDDGTALTGIQSAFSSTVHNAGDVNNDGIDDIIIGNFAINTALSGSGDAFLVFGDTSANLDALNPLGGSNGSSVLEFPGPAAFARIGRSVSGIGDINHDGFDDFILGATLGVVDKGKAYVIFGDTQSNLATLSGNIINHTGGYSSGLDSLNGANGGVVISNTPAIKTGNGTLGFASTNIGDFNGDGYDDFSVTANSGNEGFVVFGKASLTNINLATDLIGPDTSFSTNGFTIFGTTSLGISVAGAGDVNGDGLQDLIIGAPSADQAYILFGTTDIAPLLSEPASTPGSGLLIDLTGDVTNGAGSQLLSGGILHGAGVRLEGISGSDMGRSVAGAGDVNGDGYDDVIVGARNASSTTATGAFAGQAYIVYGQDFSGAGAPPISALATANNARLYGDLNNDTLDSAGFSNVVQRGGAGNDVLRVNGSEFSVDGGGGLDILTPDAINQGLDYRAISNQNVISNIEDVQLNGFGTNTLNVDIRDVLDMSGVGNELLVTGDSGVDSVTSSAQGWALSGSEVRSVLLDSLGSSQAITFNIYAVAGSSASLLVQQDLNQALIS